MLERLGLSVSSWGSDVLMIGRAIACGQQELTCIKCVLQTSFPLQFNTLPIYRNCHSHQISTLVSHKATLGLAYKELTL